MKLRSKETSRFEQTKTAVVAKPIAIPLTAAVVTARVGHIPIIIKKMGFSFQRAVRKLCTYDSCLYRSHYVVKRRLNTFSHCPARNCCPGNHLHVMFHLNRFCK